MDVPAYPRRLGPALACLALVTAAVLVATIPAVAFNGGWTKPKRVFSAGYAPDHAMVTDSAGAVHIATERGTDGVWYVTNASGSWVRCRISDGNDRQPGIAASGDTIHIAFARRTVGQRGIYTASSDQPAGTPGCGWTVTPRHLGSASHPSLEAWGNTLSVAFRTGAGQLKFMRGTASDPTWTVKETIDSGCCTSPAELELTTHGAPRVVYGDGRKRANGLKYGVRTSSGWKKQTVTRGRIKLVALTLDRSPGIGNPPPNSPWVLFVKKGKGTYSAHKGPSGISGSWGVNFERKVSGQPQIEHWSNNTTMLYGGGGKLWIKTLRVISFERLLSGSGKDVKPQLHGSQLTFARKSGTKGIYYSRPR